MISASGINDNVLAFRKLGKNNIDFANLAFEEILKRKITPIGKPLIEVFKDETQLPELTEEDVVEESVEEELSELTEEDVVEEDEPKRWFDR